MKNDFETCQNGHRLPQKIINTSPSWNPFNYRIFSCFRNWTLRYKKFRFLHKIHPYRSFYPHLIRVLHNCQQVHCHYHRGIYAICLRLNNQFVRPFEHAFDVMLARQFVGLYRRAITGAARRFHVTQRYQSSSGILRDARSYRRRRDTAKCRRTAS